MPHIHDHKLIVRVSNLHCSIVSLVHPELKIEQQSLQAQMFLSSVLSKPRRNQQTVPTLLLFDMLPASRIGQGYR